MNTRISGTWLTRRPARTAKFSVLISTLLLLVGTLTFWSDIRSAGGLMPASGTTVFRFGQWWRLWTALFAHGDLGHLLSNVLLFVPLMYLLAGYFGSMLMPVAALLAGGLINILVLKTMPADVALIGVSGVVYWMGATWLALFLFIDRSQNVRRRLAKVLIVTFMLFLPEAYKPEVSYVSHFLGYVLGALSGTGFFYMNRTKYRAAEIIITEDESDFSTLPAETFAADSTQPPQ